MSKIGHNGGPSSAFMLAQAENKNTALYLLGREFLVTAIQDRRLERSHLRVMACIVLTTNSELKAWPSRAYIAERTGLAVKTVSNILLELRNLGYLITDKEEVPEANDRRLTVYTFGKIDHETIRREITRFVEGIRAAQSAHHEADIKSPPAGNSEEEKSPPAGNFELKVPAHGEQTVPASGELPRPRGTSKSPPTGNLEPKVTAHGEHEPQKSPPAGDSTKTLYLELESETPIEISSAEPKKPKRKAADVGTRLPEDWVLTKALGEWALANFDVSAQKVRSEAAAFKDFWTAKPGAAGRKLDWGATWRNWCRNAKGWRARPSQDEAAAPTLLDTPDAALADYHAEWDKARAMMETDDAES